MKHRMWLVGILLLALVVSASAQTFIDNFDLGPVGGQFEEYTWYDIELYANQVYKLKADPDFFPDGDETLWDLTGVNGPVFSGKLIARPTPYDYEFIVPADGLYSFHGVNLKNYFTRVNLFKM